MPLYPPASSGGASALDDLSDVAISSAARGNVLRHNGTQFVNRAPGCYHPEDYGAVADGTTDDSTAIQDAIAAADTAGGGVVVFADATYAVATGLTVIDKPGVRLVGAGAVHNLYQSTTPTRGTVLKWTGSAGGVVLTVGASSASDAVPGNEVSGLTIECVGTNTAATALKIQSSWWGVYRDLHLRDGSSVTFALTTVNLIGVEDTQGCVFEQISVRAIATASAKGITWSSHATGGGNVSMNAWHRIHIYHDDGTAWECGDSDSNTVVNAIITRAGGGTGVGIDLLGSGTASSGHCRSNAFYYVQANAGGINSRGTDSGYTQPASANRIHALDFGNSSAGITRGTGSTIYFDATNGLELLNDTQYLAVNAAGSGTVGLWRCNTLNEFQVDVASRFSTHLTIANNANISFSTTNGTKIGTGTTQKLAFFNATPIVQPANTSDIRQLLIDLGLLATGGATPLNLNGGALTTTGLSTLGIVALAANGYLSQAGIAGNPGSPAAGDHWYNTTQKSHRFQNTAAIQGLVGLIYANTADSTAITGTTSETKFSTQVALAAAGLTVGKVIRVRLMGTVTTDNTASQTLTINIKLGDATNATSGTTVATTRLALTISLTNANWYCEADIIIRSATTAWGAGFASVGSTVAAPWTATPAHVSNGGGVGTVTTIPNISTAHTVHVTAIPNDTGQSVVIRTMTVELLD